MEHTPIVETFAARLARLRGAAHMTHAELAEAVGVNRSTVCRWESGTRGARIALGTLRDLACTLGCTLDDLAGE